MQFHNNFETGPALIADKYFVNKLERCFVEHLEYAAIYSCL